MPTRQERIEGGLLGLLVGDALGVPYEFQPPARIPAAPGDRVRAPDGYPRAHAGVRAGTYSDDGAQASACSPRSWIAASSTPTTSPDGSSTGTRTGTSPLTARCSTSASRPARRSCALKAGTPALEAGPADERPQRQRLADARAPAGPLAQGDRRRAGRGRLHAVGDHPRPRPFAALLRLYCLWASRTLEASTTLARRRRPRSGWSWPTSPRGSTSSTRRSAPTTPPSRPAAATWSTASSRRAGRRPPARSRRSSRPPSRSATTPTPPPPSPAGSPASATARPSIPDRWLDSLRGRELFEPLLKALLDHAG